MDVEEVVPVDPSPADVGVNAEVTGTEAEAAIEERDEVGGNGAGVPSGIVRSSGELLGDYIVYNGPTGPDPRTVSISAVADGLCSIIETEGPMIAKRAYDIYLRGCGIKRLGGELKSTMNKALGSAVHQGRVISENEPGQSGMIFSTVRSKGSPSVNLRCRGPRIFEEIPPGELRAVGHHLVDAGRMRFGSDEHLRAILDCFGLKRLTTQVGTTLLEILTHRNQDRPADASILLL